MVHRQYLVLCTRKLDDAWTKQALLHDIRLESRDFLEIRPLSPEIIRPVIEQNAHPLVFTSHHAVCALAAFTAQHHLKTRACFCIEGTTSKAATEAGFELLASARDSGALAQQIIASGHRTVLHCSSKNRRPELEEILTAAGIETSFLEVYGKTAAPLPVPAADGIIFYSPSQIDAFLEANILDKTTPAFCIGMTTAGHLAATGHTQIHVASRADTEAILQTVFEHFNQA